jgi:hypothetical protein
VPGAIVHSFAPNKVRLKLIAHSGDGLQSEYRVAKFRRNWNSAFNRDAEQGFVSCASKRSK